jgi:hypothetical protein
MNKIVLAFALFALVGTGFVNAANLGDDKNKKECSAEKKSCCKSKSAKACNDMKATDKASAKADGKTEAVAKVSEKAEETKK